MKIISTKTTKRQELKDITDLVRETLGASDIKDGAVHIFIPHATAGITLNENADPNLPKDISNFLKQLVPEGKWMHDRIDNNADAHIKASLIGNSVLIPVKDGEMQLGTWQDIFLCEFDGPRSRNIILNQLKELK